jgi:hypothetical protein
MVFVLNKNNSSYYSIKTSKITKKKEAKVPEVLNPPIRVHTTDFMDE